MKLQNKILSQADRYRQAFNGRKLGHEKLVKALKVRSELLDKFSHAKAVQGKSMARSIAVRDYAKELYNLLD